MKLKRNRLNIGVAATFLITMFVPFLSGSNSVRAQVGLIDDTSTPVACPSWGCEFFQLTFPLASKPKINYTTAIVYNAIIDHSGGFYANSTDRIVQPYTGEEAIVGSATPVTVRAPGTVPAPAIGQPGGRVIYYNGHSGLDLDANTGTPVYAAHAGYVMARGTDPNSYCYGNRIVLQDEHNTNFLTLYAHLNGYVAAEGAHIARGELLGYSGNSPNDPMCSSGPHLHFGLYYSRRFDSAPYVLDPYNWFSQKANNLGAAINDYKWASGYSSAGSTAEPSDYDWNKGTVTGNDYIHRDRTRNGSARVGFPVANPSNNNYVGPIEHWYAVNYGSAGAPFGNAFASGNDYCQFFEGGTFCSRGANYQDGSYSYPFQDVPLNFWAHRYIDWAKTENVLAGYPCDNNDPQRPCVGPENKPYFLPQNNVTRQQFAKLMYNTFSLSPNLAGAPHFCDVPQYNPDNTVNEFYTYIETLYNMGVFSGYSAPSCGYSSAEFRPADNLSRQQLAKILSNTAQNRGWLNIYNADDATDFWDVPKYYADGSLNPFFPHVEKLYKAGIIQYRVEQQGHTGKGGQFYAGQFATRGEVAQFLHETVYATTALPQLADCLGCDPVP